MTRRINASLLFFIYLYFFQQFLSCNECNRKRESVTLSYIDIFSMSKMSINKLWKIHLPSCII